MVKNICCDRLFGYHKPGCPEQEKEQAILKAIEEKQKKGA